MQFEWDDKKNKSNIEKHNISFEEAILIFKNPVFSVESNKNSSFEVRTISIGLLENTIVILVVHTKRGKKTRIISARPAKKKERNDYYGYLQKKT